MLCSRYLASSRLLCILLDSYNPSTAFLASPKLLCLLLRLLVCHFQSFYSFFFLHLPEVHLGFLGLFQTVFTILGISAATLLSPAFFFPTPGLFAVILLASVLSEQLQWYSLLSYWTFRISAAFLSSPRFVVYSPWFFFCLSTIIFLPLWGYTVFSESFTYSIDGLHWKYLSGYFQALCLFCVFGFFSSENPWVLWRSFNLRDAFFLYLRLFCILLVGHLSRWFLWPLAQQHFIPSGTYFFTFQ